MTVNIPTPHIKAFEGEIAKNVLMPGDPLRAKFIAEKYLSKAKCFNTVRGMLGFTGEYKGKKVSIMGSGMGMPSIGIYSYELYNFYGVDNIIRIGSAGAFQDDVNLKDIVIAMGACTDSNYGSQYELGGTFAPIASYDLLVAATKSAKKCGAKIRVGNVLSSDVFYSSKSAAKKWKAMGVLAVEMESAALYMNAAASNKSALCILTISDHVFKGESLPSEERETGFCQMTEVALETVLSAGG